MIDTSEAIRTARALLGTSYDELDCINFIKKVIRTSAGGDSKYTTAGTNALWDSFDSSPKYRDLTWRQESVDGAKPGMLIFMGVGTGDVNHVGLVTDEGTVLHSSMSRGGVVETALTEKSTWNGLGVHRMIEVDGGEEERSEPMWDNAVVKTQKAGSYVNLREGASTRAAVIGKVYDGERVNVLREAGTGWIYGKTQAGAEGYMSADYIVEDAPSSGGEDTPAGDRDDDTFETTTLTNGSAFVTLVGKWTITND